MKVSLVILGIVVACVTVLAAENSPLLSALCSHCLEPEEKREVQLVDVQPDRQKRSLLLGAAAGAGLLGAGVLGAGLVGAGVLGAGVLGAKAGLVGGALATKALYHGRSYGGYGGGWSYGGYGGYGGGYGGYGGGYRSYRRYYPSYYSGYGYSSW